MELDEYVRKNAPSPFQASQIIRDLQNLGIKTWNDLAQRTGHCKDLLEFRLALVQARQNYLPDASNIIFCEKVFVQLQEHKKRNASNSATQSEDTNIMPPLDFSFAKAIYDAMNVSYIDLDSIYFTYLLIRKNVNSFEQMRELVTSSSSAEQMARILHRQYGVFDIITGNPLVAWIRPIWDSKIFREVSNNTNSDNAPKEDPDQTSTGSFRC